MKNPCIGFRRIYSQYFSIGHLLSYRRRRSQGVVISKITGHLVKGAPSGMSPIAVLFVY